MNEKVTPEQIAQWRESDRRHHYHPMTNPKQYGAQGGATVMTHADGVFVYDSDGNRYLDGLSGLGCVNIGYGNQQVTEAAYEAMRKLPFMHTYAGTTNPWVAQLSQKLAEVTPEGFEHFFYASSGSEAVETAVKMTLHYWRLRGQPSKRKFISRDLSYHGNTLFSASLTGISAYHDQFGLPMTEMIGRVDAPYWWREGDDLSEEAFVDQLAARFEAYVKAEGAENIAALVAEPVQGTAGLIVPPAGYWERINRICRENDILIICDEVITGFGKTGRWFGCETFGIEADFLAMAKGLSSSYLPISAVAVGDRVGDVLLGDDHDFVHGFTCNGHPVSAAAAVANIKVIEEQELVAKVADVLGPYFGNKMRELGDSPIVGEVRHCGVMAALEFSPDKARKALFPKEAEIGNRVTAIARANGVIVRPLGNTLSVVLPMIAIKAEVDVLVDVLRAAIAEVAMAL